MRIGEITAEKRARNVCIVGLMLQLFLAVFLTLVYRVNDSAATFAVARLTLGGIFIWLALWMLYQQRRRVAEESLETERLKQQRDSAGTESIFDLEEEDFLVARRRLQWMHRWLLPSFVMLTVAYLLGGYFVAWPIALFGHITDNEIWGQVNHASLSMLIVAGIAFISFLFSRYVGGMAREPEYRLLRAGSIFLFASALACLLLTICLGLASTGMSIPERVLAIATRYLMVLVGLEFLANFVLDFYRPRVTDGLTRPAFESRLIGLISEPGGIAKSIADAVNYQFGFEVSATWFYKMLERAVVPLAALSILVLVGMSTIVVVDADQLAVIERFGRRLSEEPVKPGLHFKYPWPIDQARKATVTLVQEMIIGEVGKGEESELEEGAERVITWTEEHKFVPFVDVLVATPEAPLPGGQIRNGADEDGGAVAVSILRISMAVHYRVKDDAAGFFDYLYNYEKPQAMLRDIAYRELVKQAVHFDYQKIMGEQRAEVTERLETFIQEKCDAMALGLKIVFVGLQDVHPPTENDVAAAFQRVATAEQRRDTLIEAARVDYAKELVRVAGHVRRAETLYALIQEKDELGTDATERLQAIERDLNRYTRGDLDAGILPVQGEAGQRIQEARADAEDEINRAFAKVNTFKLERVAFEASPRLYKMRKVLAALSQELDGVRKYVVVVDPEKTSVIIEYDERETSGLEIIESSSN